MVSTAHIEKAQIQDHMPVVGSDGRPFGIVDHLAGDHISLTRNDLEAGGLHRYLPLGTVAGVDGGVIRLCMPAAQVRQACLTEDEVRGRTSMDPYGRARFGLPHDAGPHGSRDRERGDNVHGEHGTSGQASCSGERLPIGARDINN